jgi:hypothetical protein
MRRHQQKLLLWITHGWARFRPLLSPQIWLKPKTVLFLFAGWLIVQVGDLGVKWLELNMEEHFKSAGISVEYGKIESLTSSDLDRYAEGVGCKMFQRDLDDDVLTNYFVIPFTFRNFTQNPVGPVSFVLDVGSRFAKIIDVQYSVVKPKGKKIDVRHNLPELRWSLPTNNLHCGFQWSPQPGASIRVLCSVAKTRGFGQVTPVPLAGSEVRLELAPNRQPCLYFFQLTAENLSGEADSSNIVALPNPIYLAKPLSKSPTNPTPTLKDNANMDFLEGRTTISFGTGLDPDATIVVYVCGKVGLGEPISPSLKMDGQPGVLFKEENSPPVFDNPYTELLSPARLAITPLRVRAVSASDKVVFFWDSTACSNYSGVKVFRSRERLIGDFAYVGEKMFEGFGSTNAFVFKRIAEFSQPETTGTMVTNYQKFFDRAPADIQAVVTTKRPTGSPQPPLPPENLKVFAMDTRRGFVHFIDTPPERNVVFTYTFYAFDHSGNQSYPVVVNASLDSSASNCTFSLLP